MQRRVHIKGQNTFMGKVSGNEVFVEANRDAIGLVIVVNLKGHICFKSLRESVSDTTCVIPGNRGDG